WLVRFLFLLLLISGSGWIIQGLVNHYQNKKLAAQFEREIEQTKKERVQQYHEQQKHLINLNSLTDNPQVHDFFTDLLTAYARNYPNQTNLDTLPLVFGGFYSESRTGKGGGRMGECFIDRNFYPTEEKRAVIRLNQVYLLN